MAVVISSSLQQNWGVEKLTSSSWQQLIPPGTCFFPGSTKKAYYHQSLIARWRRLFFYIWLGDSGSSAVPPLLLAPHTVFYLAFKLFEVLSI